MTSPGPDSLKIGDSVAEEQETLQPGTELGAYRICELIGVGGMGFVYLAEHTRLGRKVAVKLLRSSHARKRKLVQRFFREARAVNQINHEHIVQITDFVEGEGGLNYYIMELLKGQTLGERMLKEGARPLARVLSIGIQTSEALSAVHEQGIVHRDLKPDNIFLTERWGQRDFVKLLDFGVVKLTEGLDGDSLGQTDPGAVLGTPAYMSPEQVSGKPVDHLSDVYSLGIILYEMVTGTKPFKGKSYGEMIIKHLSVKPTRPSKLKKLPEKLPPRLEELIMRCLEKSPADRPQSVAEVLSTLVAIAEKEHCELETFVTTVHTELPIGRPRRSRRTGWLIAGLAALAVLGAILGVTVLPRFLDPVEGAAEPTAESSAAASDDNREATPQVRVKVDSEPRGAEVFVSGSDKPLGLTPLLQAFDRSEKKVGLELRMPGHLPSKREVSLERDAHVKVKLTRSTRKAGRRGKRRVKRGSKRRPKEADKLRHGTLDPFGK